MTSTIRLALSEANHKQINELAKTVPEPEQRRGSTPHPANSVLVSLLSAGVKRKSSELSIPLNKPRTAVLRVDKSLYEALKKRASENGVRLRDLCAAIIFTELRN